VIKISAFDKSSIESNNQYQMTYFELLE